MSIPAPTPAIECPPWCAHDHAVRDRDGSGMDLHSSITDASGVELSRADLHDPIGVVIPGDPEVVVDGRHDAPLTPTEARARGLALLLAADRAERAPRGGGVPRFRGRPVLPRGLHDVLCAWRIASRDDERAHVAWCAGCGLGVALD